MMQFKLFLLIFLTTISTNLTVCESSGNSTIGKQPKNDNPTSSNQVGKLGNNDLENSASNVSPMKLTEDQTASPSVTSVHQVWTSTSSGSLEELSPEIIGKLRNDVPFLAAYALRPRLVGASPTSVPQSESLLVKLPSGSYTKVNQLQKPDETHTFGQLQTQASSPQKSQASLIPKLGDFNEFNVETSSVSRSEHRHRRKTSLKRKQNEDNLKAGQLVRRRLQRAKSTGSKLQGGGKMINKSKSKRYGKRRDAKLRKLSKQRKLSKVKQMKSNRRGRYLQEESMTSPFSGSTSNEGKESKEKTMDIDMKSHGEEMTLIMSNEKTMDEGEDGVKGGTSFGVKANKKPFYSGLKPNSMESDVDYEGGKVNSVDRSRTDKNNVEDDDEEDDTEGADELSSPTPKRVGDDDIEEGGDTVTVMPKSDGVDDDPEIPVEENAPDDSELGNEGNDQGSLERENKSEKDNGVKSDSGSAEDGNDADDVDKEDRTQRVNREKPMSSGDDNETALGGGIGATTGGGSGPSEAANGDDIDDGQANDSGSATGKGDSSSKPSGSDRKDNDGKRAREDDESIGMDDEPSDGEDSKSFRENERDSSSRSSGKDLADENYPIDRDQEGARSKGDDGSSKNGRKSSDRDDELDVDYRDEMVEAEKKNPSSSSGGSKEHHDDRKKKSGAKDCNDGSYDHHSDHHHGDEHHHHHHDTIKWLQESIPGEPGEDYPILSRVNITNFKCTEHKHPGYYADVDSGCQVFHICQADGRQDSFLCPNGTIFSQKSLVCVWWNSFDCEDAPKYYELNSLLYKTSPESSKSLQPSNLRPLGRANEAHDDDSASLDSLIKAMRRSKESNSANSGNEMSPIGVTYDRRDEGGSMTSLMENDEATIQRKSNRIDDDSSFARTSRLRTTNGEPRRKRRASVKQAPPKLKSRRVSRNSRRRKLRHGIKPKRRA